MHTPPAPRLDEAPWLPQSSPAPARKWIRLVGAGLLLFLAGAAVGFQAGQSAADNNGKRGIFASAFALFGVAHNEIIVTDQSEKKATPPKAE